MIQFCQAVLARLDKDTVVIPGHGAISDRAGLAHYIDMLQAMHDSIGAMVVAGASLAEVIAAKPTAAYDDEFGDPSNFVDRAYTSLVKAYAATQTDDALLEAPTAP